MKTKTIILIVVGLMTSLISLYIVTLGYGGGKPVRPIQPNEYLIKLKKDIQIEVNSESVSIRSPRNYELDNCNKYGFQEQHMQIHIDNDLLKNETSLKTYIIGVNQRLQKIFPYDKKCYDSVVIQTQYFDAKIDSTINNRFSFPMIK